MNCRDCGFPYVIGSPHNPRCAEEREARQRRDEEMDRMLARWPRPYCCPDPRCEPIHQLIGGDKPTLAEPEPGASFVCFGRMPAEVTFTYDGDTHPNDLHSCNYTPLKGLIVWQENANDWAELQRAYADALDALRAVSDREDTKP